MNNTVILPEDVAAILKKLAEEDGATILEVLRTLIEREDIGRHRVWDQSAGGFVRNRCVRLRCAEINVVPLDRIGE